MWSVARVKTNQAHIAARNLVRQGFEIFNPTYAHQAVVRNKVVTQNLPLFPTYLFVELQPHQRWAAINSTYGILKLLVRMGPDGYNTPSAIDDNFIDQLRCCCVVKERERVWLLRPGSVVTIVNGPLASHEGIVEWSSERRVRLLLHLLNHSTSVELAVSDVIAVSPST